MENAQIYKGLKIDRLVTCGTGSKNPVLLQIVADVTGKNVYVSKADETVAVGAAMLAAVASGHFSSIEEAQARMGGLKKEVYMPDTANNRVYEQLFLLYKQLHDQFGKMYPVMKTLLAIQREATQTR